MLSPKIKNQLRYVTYLFLLIFCIELVNLFTGRVLNQFSIIPRVYSSLPFIFTAPLLHASFQHFLSNIITLCIFAFLLLQFGHKQFVTTSILLVITSGLLVWLFGRSAYHLGASGIIYGYFGFLVLAGFLSKKMSLMFISTLVAFFYGTMVWGVLPSQPYISWESHLFGFLSGLIIAWFMAKRSYF